MNAADPNRGFAFKPRDPMENARAQLAHQQRTRLDMRMRRLLPQRRDGVCVVSVVGGRGRYRRLADMVAPLVSNVTIDLGAPIETVDRVAATDADPRVLVFSPLMWSTEFLAIARVRKWRVTDMLAGLRNADREAFLRIMLRSFS